jgi:hypothetical protein
MQEILLVNPKRRPSKRRKAASPAQKRARAAFAARSRSRSKGTTVMANPRRRRAKRTTARKANPSRVRYVTRARKSNPRRRRNPLREATGKPLSLLTPALVGALGATAVNTLLSYITPSLPATLTSTPNMMYLTQLAAGLGLAFVAPHAGSKRNMIMQMAEGSLTVTLHSAIVGLSGGMGMTLSGRGRMNGMGVYMPGKMAVPTANGLNGMGAYLTGSGSPAAQIQAQRQLQAAARAPSTRLRGIQTSYGF